MLGAVGKAQRTGSKTRLRDRDRELKLTGVPSGPNPAPEGPPSVCFSTPHQAPSIIPFSSPWLRPQSCSIPVPPCPCVPWGSLGKAFSRAGVSKKHPDPTC